MPTRPGDRPRRSLAEFLTALAPHTTLTRVGEQFQGGCPICGGSKRFRVLELRGSVIAKCRECDFAWTDLLKLLWPTETVPSGPGPKLYLGDDNQFWICVNPQTGTTALHTRRPYVQDGKLRKDYSWTKGARSKTLIYRARLTGDGPLVVTEGEKCADAIAARGLDAIGIVTGAPTVPNVEALADCRGREDVLLWPEDDGVGLRLMAGVAALPLGATRVRTVDPSRIGVHDAADWRPGPGVDVRAALDQAATDQPPPVDDMILDPGALDGATIAPEAPAGRFVPFSQVQPRNVTWLRAAAVVNLRTES